MELNSVIVESLFVMKNKTEPFQTEIDARDHHSLSYRLYGENIITAGTTEVISGARSLTFVPAGVAYRHHNAGPSAQIVAHFKTRQPAGNRIECFFLPSDSGVGELFSLLHEQWKRNPKENNLRCMAIFYEILALIREHDRTIPANQYPWLEASVARLHERYTDSGFSIGELYREICVSPAYYRRVFLRAYGCSPVRYLKQLRINRARHLLQLGCYSVAEVAEMSGFSSETYFSSEYKRMTGSAPSKR